MNGINIITPDWPAPTHIHAYSTCRNGGVSEAPYHSFNFGEHVGDDQANIEANRSLLKKRLNLPTEPIWLKQVHSTIVLPAIPANRGQEADALFSQQPNQVCVVTTADCLPLLLCDRNGTQVAAIHAGWRGLANGIIENTLQKMNLPANQILAWLGPAIGPRVYELGDEVRQYFIDKDAEASRSFVPSKNAGRWLGNLYSLATLRLEKQNISAIYGGEYCTYSASEQFFSYRRDGIKTGRMASLIWMT